MEKITHMGDDLHGASAGIIEIGERGWGEFQGAGGAVSQCGKGVAKKIPFFIHCGTISHAMAA
ncbi:MAG TPA: hypothetical protein VGG45_05380 [Terracidiphilus sp.]